MKHEFDEIYSGANQFKVGNYIGIFHNADRYYPMLMGSIPEDVGIAILNDKFENMLESRKNCKTIVNLIYSTKEHTYTDDIKPMLQLFDECHIHHKDQIESFTEHSMIGFYMSKFCKNNFK